MASFMASFNVREPDVTDQRIRQTSGLRQGLSARFAPNDTLKISHQHWIRVGAGNRANNIEGVIDIGDPITHGLVHGILQRSRARRH